MGLPRTSIMLAFMVSFLLISLLQSHQPVAEADSLITVAAGTPANINCGVECDRRCSKTKRPNTCKRACMSCCHTCACVPPGTFGNKDVCPCYANLLNPKNGVHKCP